MMQSAELIPSDCWQFVCEYSTRTAADFARVVAMPAIARTRLDVGPSFPNRVKGHPLYMCVNPVVAHYH